MRFHYSSCTLLLYITLYQVFLALITWKQGTIWRSTCSQCSIPPRFYSTLLWHSCHPVADHRTASTCRMMMMKNLCELRIQDTWMLQQPLGSPREMLEIFFPFTMSYGDLIQLLGLTQQAYLLLELCHQLSSFFFFISHLSCPATVTFKVIA